MPEVVIGVDAHKRTHTLVAANANGRKLGEKTIPTTTAGNQAAIRWARERFGGGLVWGIEDCRSLTGRLEHDLLATDAKVVRVPPASDEPITSILPHTGQVGSHRRPRRGAGRVA